MDNSKSYFIWGAAGLLVLLLVAILIKAMTTPQGEIILETARPVESDWVRGKADSKLVVIEYGDYQCTACKRYEPVISSITKDFEDRVLFVYRHFPLRDSHPNATIAAVAAESAGKQGKYWEMHDKLFDRQDEWADQRNPKEFFEKYALEMSLDVNKFKSDLNGDDLKQKVNNSYRAATSMGIPGTPSFFVNGKLIDTPVNYDKFKALLEEKIAAL